MKARIKIMLKNGVLDPQGEAIKHALNNIGFENVTGVRQGKVIELESMDLIKVKFGLSWTKCVTNY